jgi:hypothetical protein
MRNTHILKFIVDVIWIFSFPVIPLIIVFIPYIFFTDDFSGLNLVVNGIDLEVLDINSKLFVAISLIAYLAFIYCVYRFRKLLRYFLAKKIFDNQVIKGFNVIASLLTLFGFIMIVVSFVSNVINKKLEFEIGVNSNLMIICLGLFFLVLSETFKASKEFKKNSDLTI